ncbi:30S ribosomal protein S18 [Bacteriovoracaceae bacterium]|nr:30S ribosomal protein S18 [Bacteriovoracaceae bacterium]
MIYETAVVVRADLTDDAVTKVKELVTTTIESMGGEILINDDWGTKTFAQPTNKGVKYGKYFFVMFKSSSNELNTELERRFRISEEVMKFIIVKCGLDRYQDTFVKGYKNPNTKSTDDVGNIDSDKEKRLFAKRKSCYFSAKKTAPDWKDPSTYSWLVNEFGKISPARVTGLRPRYQRSATTAIKRGRNMGLISYINGNVAR